MVHFLMQQIQTPSASTTPPGAAIGTVRRFGPHGVLYEVLQVNGTESARIRVIETGEELSYPIAKLIRDPDA